MKKDVDADERRYDRKFLALSELLCF